MHIKLKESFIRGYHCNVDKEHWIPVVMLFDKKYFLVMKKHVPSPYYELIYIHSKFDRYKDNPYCSQEWYFEENSIPLESTIPIHIGHIEEYYEYQHETNEEAINLLRSNYTLFR